MDKSVTDTRGKAAAHGPQPATLSSPIQGSDTGAENLEIAEPLRRTNQASDEPLSLIVASSPPNIVSEVTDDQDSCSFRE